MPVPPLLVLRHHENPPESNPARVDSGDSMCAYAGTIPDCTSVSQQGLSVIPEYAMTEPSVVQVRKD